MKILFLEWKSYCVPDMAEALTEAGHDVTLATCAEMTDRYNTEFDIFFERKRQIIPYIANRYRFGNCLIVSFQILQYKKVLTL